MKPYYRRTTSRNLKVGSGRSSVRLSDVWSAIRYTFWCLGHAILTLLNLNPVSLGIRRWRQLHYLNTRMTLSIRPRLVDLARDFFLSDDRRKKKLLFWVKSLLPWVGQEVFDFTACWQDGVVLCALMEAINPGACPGFNLLKPHHRVNNCRFGIQLAMKYLQVTNPPLSPEEMAIADETSEVKICHLVQLLKWKYQKQGSKPKMFSSSSIEEPVLSKCQARGTGIRAGIVGRRTKFNILTDTVSRLDMEIEIRGPNNEYNKEKIVSMHVGATSRYRDQVTVTTTTPAPGEDGKLKLIDDGAGHSFLRQKSLDDDFCHTIIPFDYQCVGEGRFLVTYIPRSAGVHYITILSQGQHIEGSPFEVKVSDWVSSWNLVPKTRIVPFDMLQTIEEKPNDSRKMTATDRIRVSAEHILRYDERKLSHVAHMSKQMNMTKRKILRKVITSNGEEIICEVTPSPTLSRQSSADFSDISEEDRRMSFSKLKSIHNGATTNPDTPAPNSQIPIKQGLDPKVQGSPNSSEGRQSPSSPHTRQSRLSPGAEAFAATVSAAVTAAKSNTNSPCATPNRSSPGVAQIGSLALVTTETQSSKSPLRVQISRDSLPKPEIIITADDVDEELLDFEEYVPVISSPKITSAEERKTEPFSATSKTSSVTSQTVNALQVSEAQISRPDHESDPSKGSSDMRTLSLDRPRLERSCRTRTPSPLFSVSDVVETLLEDIKQKRESSPIVIAEKNYHDKVRNCLDSRYFRPLSRSSTVDVSCIDSPTNNTISPLASSFLSNEEERHGGDIDRSKSASPTGDTVQIEEGEVCGGQDKEDNDESDECSQDHLHAGPSLEHLLSIILEEPEQGDLKSSLNDCKQNHCENEASVSGSMRSMHDQDRQTSNVHETVGDTEQSRKQVETSLQSVHNQTEQPNQNFDLPTDEPMKNVSFETDDRSQTSDITQEKGNNRTISESKKSLGLSLDDNKLGRDISWVSDINSDTTLEKLSPRRSTSVGFFDLKSKHKITWSQHRNLSEERKLRKSLSFPYRANSLADRTLTDIEPFNNSVGNRLDHLETHSKDQIEYRSDSVQSRPKDLAEHRHDIESEARIYTASPRQQLGADACKVKTDSLEKSLPNQSGDSFRGSDMALTWSQTRSASLPDSFSQDDPSQKEEEETSCDRLKRKASSRRYQLTGTKKWETFDLDYGHAMAQGHTPVFHTNDHLRSRTATNMQDHVEYNVENIDNFEDGGEEEDEILRIVIESGEPNLDPNDNDNYNDDDEFVAGNTHGSFDQRSEGTSQGRREDHMTGVSPFSNKSGNSDWSDNEEVTPSSNQQSKEATRRYLLKGDWSPQFVELYYHADARSRRSSSARSVTNPSPVSFISQNSGCSITCDTNDARIANNSGRLFDMSSHSDVKNKSSHSESNSNNDAQKIFADTTCELCALEEVEASKRRNQQMATPASVQRPCCGYQDNSRDVPVQEYVIRLSDNHVVRTISNDNHVYIKRRRKPVPVSSSDVSENHFREGRLEATINNDRNSTFRKPELSQDNLSSQRNVTNRQAIRVLPETCSFFSKLGMLSPTVPEYTTFDKWSSLSNTYIGDACGLTSHCEAMPHGEFSEKEEAFPNKIEYFQERTIIPTKFQSAARTLNHSRAPSYPRQHDSPHESLERQLSSASYEKNWPTELGDIINKKMISYGQQVTILLSPGDRVLTPTKHRRRGHFRAPNTADNASSHIQSARELNLDTSNNVCSERETYFPHKNAPTNESKSVYETKYGSNVKTNEAGHARKMCDCCSQPLSLENENGKGQMSCPSRWQEEETSGPTQNVGNDSLSRQRLKPDDWFGCEVCVPHTIQDQDNGEFDSASFLKQRHNIIGRAVEESQPRYLNAGARCLCEYCSSTAGIDDGQFGEAGLRCSGQDITSQAVSEMELSSQKLKQQSYPSHLQQQRELQQPLLTNSGHFFHLSTSLNTIPSHSQQQRPPPQCEQCHYHIDCHQQQQQQFPILQQHLHQFCTESKQQHLHLPLQQVQPWQIQLPPCALEEYKVETAHQILEHQPRQQHHQHHHQHQQHEESQLSQYHLQQQQPQHKVPPLTQPRQQPQQLQHHEDTEGAQIQHHQTQQKFSGRGSVDIVRRQSTVDTLDSGITEDSAHFSLHSSYCDTTDCPAFDWDNPNFNFDLFMAPL